MSKVSVYLNPRASRVNNALWENEIKNQLFRREVVFRYPQNLVELKYLIQQDLDSKVEAIVSVGGDGTIHTLIQHLVESNVALLVVPAGTANDLAHELGQIKQIKKCLWCIFNGDMESIDVIRINGRYMVTNGGLGVTSLVAQRINYIRQRFPQFKKVMRFVGKGIYGEILKVHLLFSRLHYQTLKIESLQFNDIVKTPIFMVNNQPTIAGHFLVAPETKNTDGRFNVTILTHPTTRELIHCFQAIASGEFPSDDPHLISFETQQVRVTNLSVYNQVPFFGDGEIFEDSNSYDISIIHRGLKVYKQTKNLPSYRLQDID